MKLMTISQVTKAFNVSTRMLRYYEQIGLLPSQRREDYAYRVYDENAVRRLQYIIVLRKLRIPLKQIELIFKAPEQIQIIEIFQKNIEELNDEITSLNIIRDVLNVFVIRLNESTRSIIKFDMLQDAESKLYEKKPDARMFGFNHPNPSPNRPHRGYEDCVTIPDDMEVTAPLVKRGLRGACTQLILLHSLISMNGSFCASGWKKVINMIRIIVSKAKRLCVAVLKNT